MRNRNALNHHAIKSPSVNTLTLKIEPHLGLKMTVPIIETKAAPRQRRFFMASFGHVT